MTGTKRSGKQQQQGVKGNRARGLGFHNSRRRKIKYNGSHPNCRRRKKSSVPEPSFLKLPCTICEGFDHEEVTLICDGCDHPYHTYCLELKALPPKEEKWFCLECSGGVQPPVTKKVLSANKSLPQSLFPTKKEENVEGENLDNPDEMQKKASLATQREQKEAARYVLRIYHCGSTFYLTILQGY
jgi:hypothetical protein